MTGGTSLVMAVECKPIMFSWTEVEAQHGGSSVSRVLHDSVCYSWLRAGFKAQKGHWSFLSVWLQRLGAVEADLSFTEP